jgi:hypothetical protein
MSRRYATPLAFKTALEDRLRRESSGSAMDLHRRRQLLIFDRFLTRVFIVFADAVVLKGGFVVELRLERARTTKDIDVRITGDPDQVLGRLQEAGRLDVDDYLSFEVRPDPRQPEIDAPGMAYRGRRYRAQARLAGKIYGTAFGVDAAFAEPLHGDPELVEGSRFLQFAGIEPARFRIYPLETHIAEKLHAYTLPRERPNSRVKDLPDIALLASVRDIDGAALRRAIVRTFEHRATHPVPAAVPTPPESWNLIYARLAASDGLRWETLAALTVVVQQFLDPVLAGAASRWRPADWSWISGEIDE